MENNTRFSIVVRWSGDLFILEKFDTGFFCLMDLKTKVYENLRLDCSIVEIQMEGILPDDTRLKLDSDWALVEWLNKCSKAGIDTIHLVAEPLNPILSHLVESSVLADGSDESDGSYKLSDDDDVNQGLMVLDKVGSTEVDSDYNDYSDIDRDLNGSDYDDERPYLDRAYRGKIFEEGKEDTIILERGMLFGSVDAFREVLRDYVIQEGFEIVRTRNERTRFTALCAARGCEWYLHASTNGDDISFEIKVYNGVHSCT